MKAFVGWVTARRYRLILLAMAFALALPVAPVALMALDTARRGVPQGLISAALASAGMLGLGLLSGGDPALFATVGLVCFLAGVGIGNLLRRAGNLVLAFQGAVLFSFVVVALISLFSRGTDAWFAPMIAWLVDFLRASGASAEQLAVIEGRGGMVLLIGGAFSQLIGALLLAYWWLGLATGEKRFGAEFRALKLGRLLGACTTVAVALSLVFDAALVQNLTALALLGFVVQGLAVIHAWAHAKRWHPAMLVPVYVLLVTPLTAFAMLTLSAIGLMDNWLDLRAPLRAQS